MYHISFCWTSTVKLLPNRLTINVKNSYREGKQFSLFPKQNTFLVTKPSLHVAYNFAKLTPEENIFHTDIVTLENVSTSCLLFLKDRNASILKAGMACYHLLKNAFSWPNWKTL